MRKKETHLLPTKSITKDFRVGNKLKVQENLRSRNRTRKTRTASIKRFNPTTIDFTSKISYTKDIEVIGKKFIECAKILNLNLKGRNEEDSAIYIANYLNSICEKYNIDWALSYEEDFIDDYCITFYTDLKVMDELYFFPLKFLTKLKNPFDHNTLLLAFRFLSQHYGIRSIIDTADHVIAWHVESLLEEYEDQKEAYQYQKYLTGKVFDLLNYATKNPNLNNTEVNDLINSLGLLSKEFSPLGQILIRLIEMRKQISPIDDYDLFSQCVIVPFENCFIPLTSTICWTWELDMVSDNIIEWLSSEQQESDFPCFFNWVSIGPSFKSYESKSDLLEALQNLKFPNDHLKQFFELSNELMQISITLTNGKNE